MAATLNLNDSKEAQSKSSGIVDDFMYSSNVAGAHVYVRLGFLRKVYGILTAQLLVTIAVGAVFMINEPIQKFVQHNQWMLIVSLFGTLGVLFALMIKRNETPTNYILLAVFTLLESYAIGVVVTFYKAPSVIQAMVLTFGVTAALTTYTFQSKKDFSSWGASLFSVLWILILAGFMQILFPSELMNVGLGIAGAVVFSLFIIFDTHMMMHKLSPEEYILAAINLYLDILNLFLYILRILGERK